MSGQADYDWQGTRYLGEWSADKPFGALFWRRHVPCLDAYPTPTGAVSHLAWGEGYGELSSVAVVDLRTGAAVAQFVDSDKPAWFPDPWEADKEFSVIETTGYVRKKLAPG